MPVFLSGSLIITGSITTSGTITAQTLVVQTITASVVQMTGSNTFGNLLTDRQTFTGSMYVTGSQTVTGNIALASATGFPTVGFLNRASDNTLYTVAAASGFTLTDSSLNTMYNATSTSHTWNISNAAKMTISSSGNVGIGMNNPITRVFISGTGSYNAAYTEIQPTDVTIWSSEMSNNAYNSILQLVAIRQSLTTGADSNGYLGFSTIDDSNGQGVRDAGRIAIVNEAGSSRNSTTALSFWTNSAGTNTGAATEKMRVTSGGNIGIGITSPSNKVDIFGAGSSTAGTLAVRSAGGGTFIVNRLVNRDNANQTVTIATVSSPGGNDRVFFKIQVINVSAVANYGNAHVGYALWSVSGASSVTTMTLDTGNSNISNTNVGVLSWSGNNLQYTTVGAGNYENNHIIIYAVARDSATVV